MESNSKEGGESNENGGKDESVQRTSSKKRGSRRSKGAAAMPPSQLQMQEPSSIVAADEAAKSANGIDPQSIGRAAVAEGGIEAAPVQVSMDGDQDIEKPAAKLDHAATIGEDVVFYEAGFCCSWFDSVLRQCSCCCGYKEYVVTNKGLKVRSVRPCSENINNIDWTSMQSIDYETGCCFGYIEMNTRDHELGDAVLRVRKSQVEIIQSILFNLSTGSTARATDQVVAQTSQACSCCDPCACLTSYTITNRALKIKRHRCLPCMGFEGTNLRWLTQQGTDNIVDIDSAVDCCYGYVYLYTNDSKPEFQHMTMRVRRSEVDLLVSDLRALNTGASGRKERAVTSFQELGCCFGVFDPCVPSFCIPRDTRYLVTSSGLSIQTWTPCYTSTNHVDWLRVLDVDMERQCCLGFLDMHYYDQAELRNSKLRVSKKKVEELCETIEKLRSYQPGDGDDAMFNHFREAGCCDCAWTCCDSCCCPTYYVLKRNGMQVESSKFEECCVTTRRNNVKWDRVRDVDFEQDWCLGYVLLDTWDDELGNVKLRVRRAQAERLAMQIHNRSLGKDQDAVDLSHFQFNRSSCCSCLSCWRTIYIVSDSGLKVKSASCGRTRLNNIAWPRIRDVDGESTCCCAYVEVTSADRAQRDEDRGDQVLEKGTFNIKAMEKEQLDASNPENLQTVILRLWPSQFLRAFEAIKNGSGGQAAAKANTTRFMFNPRGWCDCLTCYRGYCWFYHPVEYQVTTPGLIVKRVSLCSKRGMCRSRINCIDWQKVREVNSSSSCCWGSIDIHTLDDEDPRITTRLLKSELPVVMARVRGRGEKDTE